MWTEILNILCGLVFFAEILGSIYAMGKHLEKLAK